MNITRLNLYYELYEIDKTIFNNADKANRECVSIVSSKLFLCPNCSCNVCKNKFLNLKE